MTMKHLCRVARYGQGPVRRRCNSFGFPHTHDVVRVTYIAHGDRKVVDFTVPFGSTLSLASKWQQFCTMNAIEANSLIGMKVVEQVTPDIVIRRILV